jgi:hypothetical protein
LDAAELPLSCVRKYQYQQYFASLWPKQFGLRRLKGKATLDSFSFIKNLADNELKEPGNFEGARKF